MTFADMDEMIKPNGEIFHHGRDEIIVISGDYQFSRMLELELTDADYNVRLAGSVSAAGLGGSSSCESAVIIDVDSLGDNIMLPLSGIPVLIYISNYNLDKSALPESCRILERPFSVTSLLNILNGADIPARGAYRNKSSAYINEIPDGGIVLDESTLNVCIGDDEIRLTRREFELLAYLLSRRGEPVSRDELIREVWNYEYTGNTNVVDVYIRYLREKIDEKLGIKLIVTVRGHGYKIK